MKTWLSSRIAFFCKSLVWSLMLYMVCMVAINWDEVINSTKLNNPAQALAGEINSVKYPSVNALMPGMPKPFNEDAGVSIKVLKGTGGFISNLIHIIFKDI